MENYTLKSGSVYKFEVWGGKGGTGTSAAYSGAGGNGSYAVGWYDMRSSEEMTASIFAGGAGMAEYQKAGAAGWGATELGNQLKGTPSGVGTWAAGGGGSASGIYINLTAIIVAGGGGGGGSGGGNYSGGGAGGGLTGGNGGGSGGGGRGATQSAHGAGSGGGAAGTSAGGGNGSGAGGGAGGGWKQGFAGGAGHHGPDGGQGGGGGSGGTSYIGGVQSLADTAGKASTTWTHTGATGNGKVIITEYAVGVESPNSTNEYTVSEPSVNSVFLNGSYTFTITREIGVGDVGLLLNTSNGSLALTSTDGNVFTYTVSNVQGAITANDFSVTTYNVEAPPDGEGYTVSNQSATSVLKGGSFTFIINLQNGYAIPMVSFSGNGKLSYSGVEEFGNMTVTISNVQGAVSAGDFTVVMSKV